MVRAAARRCERGRGPMETKAHHALVGFFVVFLVVAGSLFTVWLATLQFDQEFEEYDVVFEGPVRGLRESSEVRFNGIQVGEVTDIGLNPDNQNEVIARVQVDSTTPVKVDSFAQLEPQGLTGLSYIQITGGSPGAEELESRSGDGPARIFARQAQIEGLVEGGETVIENAEITLARLNRLLSDENLESVTNTLNNIETISARLAANETLIPRAERTLDTIDRAGRDVSRAAQGLEEFGRVAGDFLIEEVGPAVRDTEQAAEDVSIASDAFTVLLADIQPELEAFADEGLDSLTRAANDLQELVAALERIALQLEEDPAGFVSQPSGREREVPQ